MLAVNQVQLLAEHMIYLLPSLAAATLIATSAAAAQAPSASSCLALVDEARRANLYRDVGLNYTFFERELIKAARLKPEMVAPALVVAKKIFAGDYTGDEAARIARDWCDSTPAWPH